MCHTLSTTCGKSLRGKIRWSCHHKELRPRILSTWTDILIGEVWPHQWVATFNAVGAPALPCLWPDTPTKQYVQLSLWALSLLYNLQQLLKASCRHSFQPLTGHSIIAQQRSISTFPCWPGNEAAKNWHAHSRVFVWWEVRHVLVHHCMVLLIRKNILHCSSAFTSTPLLGALMLHTNQWRGGSRKMWEMAYPLL